MSSVAQQPRTADSSSIPEEVIRNFDAPYSTRYAKSKLFSELLCNAAAQRLDIPTSFAPVGQIAGLVNGTKPSLWNTAEWLSSLIITSISLGALPYDLGAELSKVDWMPVDILATALVELATNKEQRPLAGAEVFNVLGPRAVLWKDLVPSILASIGKHTDKCIDVVPLASCLIGSETSLTGFLPITPN